ncbi:MAG: hypothetical protein Q9172_005398 [Xanthocarpia lactea]
MTPVLSIATSETGEWGKRSSQSALPMRIEDERAIAREIPHVIREAQGGYGRARRRIGAFHREARSEIDSYNLILTPLRLACTSGTNSADAVDFINIDWTRHDKAYHDAYRARPGWAGLSSPECFLSLTNCASELLCSQLLLLPSKSSKRANPSPLIPRNTQFSLDLLTALAGLLGPHQVLIPSRLHARELAIDL